MPVLQCMQGECQSFVVPMQVLDKYLEQVLKLGGSGDGTAQRSSEVLCSTLYGKLLEETNKLGFGSMVRNNMGPMAAPKWDYLSQ